jgi:hypothetical protein
MAPYRHPWFPGGSVAGSLAVGPIVKPSEAFYQEEVTEIDAALW